MLPVCVQAARCHYVVTCTALGALAPLRDEHSLAPVTAAASVLGALEARVNKWATACSTRQLNASGVSPLGVPAESAALFLDARGTAAAAAALVQFRQRQLAQQRLAGPGITAGDTTIDEAYRKAVTEVTHDGVSVALGKVGESGKSALYVSLDGGGTLTFERAEVLVPLGVQIMARPPPVRGFRLINNTGKVSWCIDWGMLPLSALRACVRVGACAVHACVGDSAIYARTSRSTLTLPFRVSMRTCACMCSCAHHCVL